MENAIWELFAYFQEIGGCEETEEEKFLNS